MTTTIEARTARKPRRCDNDGTRILPGDRYLRHVVFPDADFNSTGRPYALAECVPCAVTSGRDMDTGACLSYCHGVEPCSMPFKHNGDHRCHQCRPNIAGDHAELVNLGHRWALTVYAAGVEHWFTSILVKEDESPRDAAVREIRKLGYQVKGDGSWYVAAYIGRGADRTWTYLEQSR